MFIAQSMLDVIANASRVSQVMPTLSEFDVDQMLVTGLMTNPPDTAIPIQIAPLL